MKYVNTIVHTYNKQIIWSLIKAKANFLNFSNWLNKFEFKKSLIGLQKFENEKPIAFLE